MSGPIKFARTVHLVSAFWTLALALLIFGDVAGRSLLSQPLAIYSGSMLRTSIFADALPPGGRRVLRTIGAVFGFAVFLGLVWSTWPAFQDAYRIGEYEGEGSLRVPTWPVRGTVLLMSVFGAWAYVTMIYYDWTGRLLAEAEAPHALTSGQFK